MTVKLRRPKTAIHLERLESRTLLSVDGWQGYALNPQHSALSTVASQSLGAILWQAPVDLDPQYNGDELLIHYGSPLITAANTVIIPTKTGASSGFEIQARSGSSGALEWTLTTDYVLQPGGYDWVPSYSPTLTPQNGLYFAADGGTVMYTATPDATGPAPPATSRLAFYGISNYNANASAYNSNIFIDTPITTDASGDIFFGFIAKSGNSLGLTSGIARIDANGVGTWAPVVAGMSQVATNSAPAISNDGNTLYVLESTGNWGTGKLVAMNSQTLAVTAQVTLVDPHTGRLASITNDATASPLVGPDGDVFIGVLETPFASNNDRGWLLHFSGDLSQTKTPGAFGWDDTPSIVPASMVPSYHGTSSYLLMAKYNNYAGLGSGNGLNQIAILDPNNQTETDPVTGTTVMNPVLSILGQTPDDDNDQKYPGAVREWCINSAAVDPATDSILAGSEDGKLYRWNLSTNTFTQVVTLTTGLGEAYTPTLIGPDGLVYAINNATLFAVGDSAPSSLKLTGFQSPATAGTPGNFTVTVYNAEGDIDSAYTGTIQFTSTDSKAALPPSYTFTANDAGVHTFSATFITTGTQSITATDSVMSAVKGSFSVTVNAPPAAAVFVNKDTTTRGNWIGAYGTQGYNVIGSGVSNPTNATITPAGQSLYTWTPAPALSATQALEVPPSGTSRIASVWYSATSFTVDVNVAAGNSYNLELYFLDYDARGRAETVTLSDANTHAMLNSQSVSNFTNGEYLTWTISGNVLITFTRTGGVNAVLNGLFFDAAGSPPPPPPPATASFVGSDTGTKGNWINVYGNQGYDVVGSGMSNPTNATITPAGQSLYTWTPAPALSATQALEVPPSGTSRIASVWYSATSFTVDVNVAAGNSYNLELYFLDYDAKGRAETVTLSDANTHATLNSQSVSNFANGEYLTWTISGNVLITFTRTGGANAVVNGLFFDPAGSPPPPPPPPPATASFVGSDTGTKGNWINVYGNQGYDVVGSGVINPTNATITPAGQSLYTWTPAPALSATQALEVPPSGTSRIASVWYSATSFTVDVNVAAGNSYNLELYFLDYDAKGRAETVTLSDANTHAMLNSQSVSNFTNGEYLAWTIAGNVLITFTRTGGANAVLNGLFFDPASVQGTAIAAASALPPTDHAAVVASGSVTNGQGLAHQISELDSSQIDNQTVLLANEISIGVPVTTTKKTRVNSADHDGPLDRE